MWKKKTLHEDYKWGEKCFVTWYSRIQGYACKPTRRQIGRQTGKQTQNGEVGVRQEMLILSGRVLWRRRKLRVRVLTISSYSHNRGEEREKNLERQRLFLLHYECNYIVITQAWIKSTSWNETVIVNPARLLHSCTAAQRRYLTVNTVPVSSQTFYRLLVRKHAFPPSM